MSKKVIIVSKTHLDLGFTGYASEIFAKYKNEYIPRAASIAEAVNKNGKKFVWTIGAWLLKKVLEQSNKEQRKALHKASLRGDIVPHAMPFTTHTELLDKDLAEYALSIVKGLDKEYKRVTIAAKLTDVPGHTKAIVPILANAGIKLLHIGVNGASAVPSVPPCFLWKHDGAEVVVIYSGDYGGEFRTEFLDDILYLDHSLDNHGPRSEHGVMSNYESIKSKFNGYEVVAGTLDDYARLLWEVREKLPIVTDEIGDSWIHGAATDPYKVGAMRELLRLKDKWLADKTMVKGSSEYNGLMDSLLCVAEHTWGMDTKVHFGDYKNYLRADFDEARAKDKRIKRGGLFRLKCFKKLAENVKSGSYSRIEKSWQEQRNYIEMALSALGSEHKRQAQIKLDKLRPKEFNEALECEYIAGNLLKFNDFEISLNKAGGIGKLIWQGKEILTGGENPILQYRSYGKEDFDFWFSHYTRNFKKTWVWAIGDFGRPHLGKVEKHYKKGRFDYTLSESSFEINENSLKILATLQISDYCYENLGASRQMQVLYTINSNQLHIEVVWCGKPANRLTEAIYFRLFPNTSKSNLTYQKIGEKINPYKVCENGSRNISAVEKVIYAAENTDIEIKIENLHSPLVCLGQGKILDFDNKFADVKEEGISYILLDNVWGTNFPLWYEDNAKFEFILKPCIKPKNLG